MRVVVDANLLVAQVLELDYSQAAQAQLTEWLEEGVLLHAPTLWRYEAVSALRKNIAHALLDDEEAKIAVRALDRLGIQEVRPSVPLEERSLVWARRLGHQVAYDATYVALAEILESELWTADRRLARAGREAGADWIQILDGSDA